jgi:hypothetical protein
MEKKKAILITLDIGIIEQLNKLHLNKSSLINALLKEYLEKINVKSI